MPLLGKNRRVRLPPFKVEAVTTALSEQVDWALAAYKVPDLWKETQGEEIKVAVLDTGIDFNHIEFKGAIDKGRNFSSGHDAEIMDRKSGHGTHTAGTIGARKNNTGVIGVAPECRLLIGKVLNDNGSGQIRWTAEGIIWAVDQGADIISMSLGSSMPDDYTLKAVEYAAKNGAIIVAAAGNDNNRPNSVNYPAKWPYPFAVSAVNQNGTLCDFSSVGPEVDIAAPGENIVSTFPLHLGSYAKLSGSSMATPFVSGVLALLLANLRKNKVPKMPVKDILQILIDSAVDAGPQGKDPQYGYGLINPESIKQKPPQPPGADGSSTWMKYLRIPARAGDWFSVGPAT